ncbi:unnamed protein product [Rotaria sordida]|uniref:Uncharacterized protein n=1 Tax=Rotaria sordida TaxID=392033 RepID=A0A816AG40_9BILA|nr:unnamed protein product [Rotaria sordida]CAF1594527.1 unnamed protein product [Rotaria sordida]
MSVKQNVINTATGASPPWPCTRDVACSPIHFGSSIELTSNEGYDDSPIILHQEKQNVQENILKNKIFNNEPSSSLSLPWSNSSSSNTTPVLSSVSSMKPVSLMSIELNDAYGVSSRRGSSSTANNINNNRWWPADPPYRYNFKNRQRRVRSTRHNQFHQHRSYDARSAMMTRINCHHDNYRRTSHCQNCCSCHDYCLM